MIDLSTLTTERRNNETFNLDQMTVAEALVKMNNEDKKVAQIMTYKDGEQYLFYSLDVPAFWDKFDDLKWGKKVFGGYVKI